MYVIKLNFKELFVVRKGVKMDEFPLSVLKQGRHVIAYIEFSQADILFEAYVK